MNALALFACCNTSARCTPGRRRHCSVSPLCHAHRVSLSKRSQEVGTNTEVHSAACSPITCWSRRLASAMLGTSCSCHNLNPHPSPNPQDCCPNGNWDRNHASQGVGKSCLVLRYVRGQFDAGSKVTIGAAFMSHTVSLPSGASVKFEIWCGHGYGLRLG